MKRGKFREFWIEPNGKKEITPWHNNPVEYRSYQCLDLPGGFWKNRAIHVIEHSAFKELLEIADGMAGSAQIAVECADQFTEDIVNLESATEAFAKFKEKLK